MPLVRSEGARAYGLAKKCRRLKPAVTRVERLTPRLTPWANSMPPLCGCAMAMRRYG
jgi:hypothetical protein